MKLAKIEIVTDGGPWATHNYPCPIYRDKHAVIDLGSGVFMPSCDAQKNGWKIVRVRGRIKNFILRLISEF